MTLNERVACGVAVVGTGCSEWLPSLHSLSAFCAEWVPVLSFTYLGLQLPYWIYKRFARG